MCFFFISPPSKTSYQAATMNYILCFLFPQPLTGCKKGRRRRSLNTYSLTFLTFILFSTKFSQLLSSFPLVRETLSTVKMVAAAWGIFSYWQTPIHPPLSSFLFLCWRAIFCTGVNGGQKFWQHTPHFTNTVESKQGINPPPSLHSHSAWCTSLRRFCLY